MSFLLLLSAIQSAAPLSQPSHPIHHGQRVSRFSTGSGGHASRGARGQRNRTVGRFGAACGAVGIQALLAGRTSLHLWAGLLRHSGADWACGGSYEDDSSGQRRSDAAEPRTVGGGGTVWHIGSAVSGTNRFGAGACSGRRFSNDAGATKEFAAEWGGFSGSAGGTTDLPAAREAGASGESDSRTREQCADHFAWIKRL